MRFTTKIARLAASSLALVALAACSATSGGTAGAAAATPAQPFDVASVTITPMTGANLCRDLGGQGAAPTVTIRHTAVAGVPIRLHLQDKLSDGSTYNHRNTRVASDGSGTTVVNYAFLPPCNTTGGRLNSHYQLTVEAGGNAETVTWARFNSSSRTIQ
jgi:hypothetical protein|tara:strand:+ start:9048 stop:9524 length:477 start_codon:yes stop_codon:yes gene_type:complete